MNSKKQKYIFFYLKTGGGHLAPARSLANYIQKNHNDKAEPILVDGFEKTAGFFRYIIEDGYRKLQSRAKWLYEGLYAINKIPLMASATALVVSLFCRKYIEEVLLRENPDKIIILHFFLIKPVYYALRKHNLNKIVYTIVTDPYTAHPLWFFEKNQNFIVFSSRLEKYISEKKSYTGINVFPFILDDKYSHAAPESKIEEIKKSYGFHIERKFILIIGGGDGIPHGKKILEEILKRNLDAVVIIVCGRNEALFNSASSLKKKYSADNLIIYGFVDFVYELLNAADIVVTKCGASTMMEILMMRKVAVVNDYIWEQEKGNIEFLIENKLGIYEPQIKKIPAELESLINNKKKYDFYRQHIIKTNLQNGTAKVAEFLITSV